MLELIDKDFKGFNKTIGTELKETVFIELKETMMTMTQQTDLTRKIETDNQMKILQLQYLITEMRHFLDVLNSRFEMAEETVSEFEGKSIEVTQSKEQREKKDQRQMDRASSGTWVNHKAYQHILNESTTKRRERTG